VEPGAPAPPLDRPGARLLAAVLGAAEERGITAVVTTYEPPFAVIELPQDGAGIVVVGREAGTADELRARLDRVLAGHAAGNLYLVLAGGGPAERAVLAAADREARTRDKLGSYHLEDDGTLSHVAGRRLGVLRAAGARVRTAEPLEQPQLPAAMERVKRAHEEAVRFSQAIERRPPYLTRALGGLCIVYYALALLWGGTGFGETLERMGALDVDLVKEGEVWRLLSYAFLHGSNTHLIMNLLALLSFGGFLESLLGWRRYLLLYGLSALVGGVASAFLGPGQSVGASGAIWGLMTAGLGIMYGRQQLLPGMLVARMRPRLFTMVAINAALSFIPHIDWRAHFAGGLVGLALTLSGLLTRGLRAPASEEQATKAPAEPRGLTIAALLMGVAMLASLALALATGRPWVHRAAEDTTASADVSGYNP
jgi:membrane associated rhomboid family serine protease